MAREQDSERQEALPDNMDETMEAAAEDEDGISEGQEEPQPLVRVRYGLAKELNLYPDAIVVARREEREETRYELGTVKRLILMPGEYVPSKWTVMFDLDDGTTIIAADGMTNHRDFRKLVNRLIEIAPAIELDPPNMDEQIMQALDIKKRNLIGCYGFVVACVALLYVVYLVVAFIGAHGPH